jgi:hypothetical protein
MGAAALVGEVLDAPPERIVDLEQGRHGLFSVSPDLRIARGGGFTTLSRPRSDRGR